MRPQNSAEPVENFFKLKNLLHIEWPRNMCGCGVWNHISLYVKLFRLYITGRKGLQAIGKRRGIIVYST
jgi:hypothetical protein